MLTPEEQKWIRRVQSALNACPSGRLGFYTIGDRAVMIYDRTKEDEINAYTDEGLDFCQGVERSDAGRSHLTFPSQVHSTSG